MRSKGSFVRHAIIVLILAHSHAVRAQGWVPLKKFIEGKDLTVVFFVDPDHGWIGGDGGTVFHTEDGGQTWSQQTIDTTDNVNDIYFRNKEHGFLLAGNRIFRTNDGGRTWIEANRFAARDFGGTPELYSIRFADKKTGWIVGTISRRDEIIDSLVLFTDDGGASWRRQLIPIRTELIHLDFPQKLSGWIVGANGTVLHTNDGGRTWTQQNTGTQATLYHVDFYDEKTGWIVGEQGTILRTIDGGATWLAVQGSVRATLLCVKFTDRENGWIVGRGGVILRSGDGGRTWIAQESKTSKNLYALFADKKRNWAVGDDGLVLLYRKDRKASD